MKVVKWIKNIISVFLLMVITNIHTIVLLVGISLVDTSAYLFDKNLGLLITGISLIVISKLIDS